MNAQGVDFAVHHITNGVVHQPVALDRIPAPECVCSDMDDVMATTARCACVTGMFGTFIDDLQRVRAEDLLEPLAQFFDAGVGHFRAIPSGMA